MDVGSAHLNREQTGPDQMILDQISIDTPELVSIEMPLAGIGSRFVALLVDYILWTVAAVVVGANSIAGGGQGSVVATVIGAFFLTYLGQVILALGFDQSVQQITEAAIIILGVAVTGFFAPSRS